MYRVLTLDGGGIKGLLTAHLLARLAEQRPRFLERVDLVAGTSTGGILALALAAGLPPTRVATLYRTRAGDIFDDSLWDDLVDLGKAAGADYTGKGLGRVLRAEFRDRRLRDLGMRVLVPAFDLNSGTGRRPAPWKPKFFHNYPGPDSDGGQAVVDVALATSAAPTYFPSHQGYVDGGIVANNPAMAALATALDPRCGGQQIADVCLLSLSTGAEPKYLAGQKLDWGWGQWARPLIAMMIGGTMGVADFQCRQLLAERYHRLDPVLGRGVDIDSKKADDLDYLERSARRVRLEATVAWLDAVGW